MTAMTAANVSTSLGPVVADGIRVSISAFRFSVNFPRSEVFSWFL